MSYIENLSKINYWGEAKAIIGKPRDSYIDTLILQKDNTNISAVVGVRRSGKSTILRQVLHALINKHGVKPVNTLYVNLEDPRLSNLLINNELFKLVSEFEEISDNRSRKFIVFDEIQNVENWESIVRTLLDQLKNTKIYITGSSANLLSRELGTKLSGRYIKTEVFPLSYVEFKKFTNKMSVKEYMHLGGFPDPVLTKNELNRLQLLRDYYESILLRDISLRYGIRNEVKLRRLSTHLFSNIANHASSYRLSKDLDLSADTILQYFNFIENAYLGFFVPKYSYSIRKQDYNPKKFYSIDNGLREAVSFMVLDDLGKLFENTVFLALRLNYKEIFYWLEEKEVDFIIKKGEKVEHIINASLNIDDKETRQREVESLQAAMYELKQNKATLVLLEGKKETIQTETGRIEVIGFDDLPKLFS